MTMQAKINNAFAALNARLIEADQKWAEHKLTTVKEAVTEMEEGFKSGESRFADLTSGYGRFDTGLAKIRHYGSRAMMNLIADRGLEAGLANMRKNSEALIAKRDAKIIKALSKAGITEIPEFELEECSGGLEGTFNVAGHIVTIRTLVAGGYNIQRLHNRTLVKVK